MLALEYVILFRNVQHPTTFTAHCGLPRSSDTKQKEQLAQAMTYVWRTMDASYRFMFGAGGGS